VAYGLVVLVFRNYLPLRGFAMRGAR
jgi:hypothetical protein